ncbi:haloacid dehalogenase type II (plasmid) [Salmonella enterica subsp. enterica serovar Karamoja]|uniref:(S)-2-haloacid dehalogenase n=1 Tax=Salmonella enterica subsp. enterica serovar Karamoja TaxID=2500153 RepID=A0A3Q9MXJ3_SALET|nr:haloacid dehalogenase type II [Salmonella enterica]AZT39693.1 haloacid dehalogenase type II [Salmonella enterica subsp. enterica serovar Karamoja]AZT44407.1 haloacid dehalogenase type II [Salmonella enterica subsp. enterica serovar Karamoja]
MSGLNAISTLYFDVNETLLDIAPLKQFIMTKLSAPAEVADAWFTSLLHHSLVDATSGHWHPFGEIAEAVLVMTAHKYGLTSGDAPGSISETLAALPAHPDVADGLRVLKATGRKLVALSNSSRTLVEQQLTGAGLRPFFDEVLSVETLATYKPDLAVYQWALRSLRVPASQAMMVAAHGWDVGGAKLAGMHTAFVARPGQCLYPLAPSPDLVVDNLRQLAAPFEI